MERRAAIAARHPSWIPTTLDRRLADAAAAFPERPLILTDDVTLTYSDVVARADAIARGLRLQGVSAGDRVALIMANVPEFVLVVFAIWRLGAAVIPVNYLFKGKELAYVINQSRCRLVITMDTFRSMNYLDAFDEIESGWRRNRFVNLPELTGMIVAGRDHPGVLGLGELEARGAADDTPLARNAALPSDPAIIMYTSGTTGLPKGVIQSHDNLSRSAYSVAHHLAYEDGRRTLTALPLYHAFALVLGLLAAPVVGGALIPQQSFDPAATLAGVQRHRASFLMLVPTMCVALLEHPDIKRYDLSSLVAVLAGGAPAPARMWQDLKTRLGLEEMFTGYGMTELSASTVLTAPDDSLALVASTVGRPLDGGDAGIPALGGVIAEYKTIDPISAADLPPGAEGELCARGPTATSGYFAKPEETAALLLPGGWVRSGDLGRIRPDGYLELTGRSKELYKSGGELVSPKEIEELFTGHPSVAQAFAVGVPDDRWGEIGCCWVVPSPGASVTEEELLALARDQLARFKVPKRIFFIEADGLPATPTGKVQKFRLIEMAKSLLDRS